MDRPESDFDKIDSFPIHKLGPAKSPWRFSRDLTDWLDKNILNFDVVVIHGLWLYHGVAAWLCLRKKRERVASSPKLYVMPHGMLDPYFQKDSSRRLKSIRNWLYWKAVESRIIKFADGVLFTCSEEMSLADRAFKPYLPKKRINLGYGVDAPPLDSTSLREAFRARFNKISDKYILFLSRLHPKKGVDLLIDAYLDVRWEFGEIPDLVIAGPIESNYAHDLKESTSQREGGKQIHFTDMLQGSEKWGAIYGSEGFILPSHQENFGIAIVEALACSVPVMITNKVNIWKEISESNAGFVENDDLEGTKALLSRFLQMGEGDLRSMKSNALKCFDTCFRLNEVANRWRNLA
jgi:glycosyltransferase involved in cell wall biosynthesis